MDLIERQLEQEEIFHGILIHLYRDKVRLPDGRESVREYIKHPGAAVMVPLLKDQQIILIRQFRYPVGKVLIELPAGKIDPQETPDETVLRELDEEIGWRPGKIQKLGMIHPCIGYSDERIYVYLAGNLERSRQNCDYDEFVEPFQISLQDGIEMCFNGEITDAKTIIALLWAERFLKANPEW